MDTSAPEQIIVELHRPTRTTPEVVLYMKETHNEKPVKHMIIPL